ncbi:Zn-ribbon domain-containing OB-fold protein, partial [Mycobacterium avium]
LLAVEQSSISAAQLAFGTKPRISRDEFPPRDLPKTRIADVVGIPISMPAYARAFEPKIRWEAAVFDQSPGIDSAPQFPPRLRVNNAGQLATEYRLEALPRTGTVYTHTTVRIPVPDLPSPYSLAVVQLDDSPVRVLLKVTGVPAGEATIGQEGIVVLRKIAIRAGIPDYGYAFWPGRTVVAEGVEA